MSAEGMSTRAIAPAVSKTQMTVVRDISEVKQNVSPAPAAPVERVAIAEQRHVNIENPDVATKSSPEPAPVDVLHQVSALIPPPPRGVTVTVEDDGRGLPVLMAHDDDHLIATVEVVPYAAGPLIDVTRVSGGPSSTRWVGTLWDTPGEAARALWRLIRATSNGE